MLMNGAVDTVMYDRVSKRGDYILDLNDWLSAHNFSSVSKTEKRASHAMTKKIELTTLTVV